MYWKLVKPYGRDSETAIRGAEVRALLNCTRYERQQLVLHCYGCFQTVREKTKQRCPPGILERPFVKTVGSGSSFPRLQTLLF